LTDRPLPPPGAQRQQDQQGRQVARIFHSWRGMTTVSRWPRASIVITSSHTPCM
jgi:hypothetical protein